MSFLHDAPTFGSLFAGIGGIDLGLERAGWRGRWQVEYEPFCQRVLAKHWPDVQRYGDIKLVDWDTVESVDLVAGGFPCQPVSYAGLGLAQDDERWLWPEFLRCVRALRPRLVLVENVPGLLTRGLGHVLGDLAEIGYDAEWDCIPAAFVGAPHQRDRIWIVAYADGIGQGWSSEVGPSSLAGLRASKARSQSDGPGDGAMANADGAGLEGWGDRGNIWEARPRKDRGPVTDQWLVEPDVGRVAHGVPARVDRLRALGNAVVPQVVEFIGRRIIEAEALT